MRPLLLGLLLCACESKPDADDTACPDLDSDGWCAGEDCDDTDASVHPDVAEDVLAPDDLDNDCDGVVDECDADDPSRTWHSEEVCDGVDNDCDGEVDEALSATWYPDEDADGWGDPAGGQQTCAPEEGWVQQDGDCDDQDATVHPGALERCDGVDDDCDPTTPEDGTVGLDDGRAFATIQEALDAAVAGAEVAVCAGTWAEDLTIGRDVRLYAPAGAADTLLLPATERSVVVVEGGDVMIEGFTLSGGRGSPLDADETDLCGGGIQAWGASSLRLVDCLVTGNTATYGGGLIGPSGGPLTVEGCVFTSNTATEAGGGLYVYEAVLSDAQVQGNQAGSSGGGFYAYQHDVRLEGCTLTGNSAVYGGGLRAYQAAVTASDTLAQGNTASYGGGAYAVDDASLSGLVVRGNDGYRGAGVYARSDATLTDLVIEGNVAEDYGGGVGCHDGALVATRVQLSGNEAHGGAGMLLDTCQLTADAVEVTGGIADYGAGLYLVAADVVAAGDLSVSANAAENAGGGVYVYSASTWSGGRVEGNTAGTGAGVFLGDVAVFEDLALSANEAVDWGGGLYTESEADLVGVVVDGNVAAFGAGLYLYGVADVWFDGGQVTANVAGTRGGGIRVAAGLLQVTVSDLGADATDNSPDDVYAGSTAYTGYGAGATFACTGSGGCL